MTSDADRSRVLMLLDSGQVEEAAELLGLLLAAEPEDGALWCLNGRALLGAGKLTEAMASAKKASDLLPQSPEPHLIASTILGRVDDLEGSTRAAREAVRLGPNDPSSWERLCYAAGSLLNELGASGERAVLSRIRELSDEVLTAADRVVALAPTESAAYRARAHALMCARRPDLAQEASRRADQIDPIGVGPPAGAEASPVTGPAPAADAPAALSAPQSTAGPAPEPPMTGIPPALNAWAKRIALALVIILVLTVVAAIFTP